MTKIILPDHAPEIFSLYAGYCKEGGRGEPGRGAGSGESHSMAKI